jgi:RNA polymerase sigma factor (sigma-70 family)
LATLAAPGVSATARSRTDVTDHDLVEAVRAGDDHAFERLYERYHRRIAAYVVGMVRDHGRAEDLTQEVFVSALRRMRQTDRPIHFKPWIYEIAKNACIDAFRRSRRAEEISFDAEQEAGGSEAARLATTSGGPDAAVDQKQRVDHLWGAFDGLSDAHHQILVMRELEGLSYAEIGKRLGLSRASVESTLFRARRRLTEEFEELQTGEACRRVQRLIGSAGATALGRRDQRRLGQHIVRCTPCRRDAVLAGLDAVAMARRPVRAKLGALLPLPAFLRRRWLGDAQSASSSGHHAAQWSAAAASYGDAPAGWLKAAAAAVALAVAGAGAGTAVTRHADAPHGGAPHGPAVAVKAVRAGGGPVAPAGGRAARAHGRRTAVARRSGPVTRSTAGAPGSTGRGAATTAPAAGGGATPPSGRSTPQTPASPSLVDPHPFALTQPSSGPTPTTAGGAVQQTTDQLGTAVGGSGGQAVQDAGAALGSTVDQVTTTAGDTVQGIVGAVVGTVQGVTAGATRPVDQAAQTTSTTVDGATGAVGDVVGGALGGQ